MVRFALDAATVTWRWTGVNGRRRCATSPPPSSAVEGTFRGERGRGILPPCARHQDGRAREGGPEGVPDEQHHEDVEPARSATVEQRGAASRRQQVGGSCSTRSRSTSGSGSHQRPVDHGRPNRPRSVPVRRSSPATTTATSKATSLRLPSVGPIPDPGTPVTPRTGDAENVRSPREHGRCGGFSGVDRMGFEPTTPSMP